jgi:maltose O-acetyltransferase
VVIGDSAFVGAGAVALPGTRIGVGAVVGAGSVVTHNVPDGVTVAGNPARMLKPKQPD